ncbi:hypothetical protein MAJ_10088, partial [Metarhizium majus ARSEF 297]
MHATDRHAASIVERPATPVARELPSSTKESARSLPSPFKGTTIGRQTDGLPALPATPGGTAATAIAGDTQRTTACSGGSHGIASESRHNPLDLTNPLACTLAVLPTASPMRPRTLRQGPETGSWDSISTTSADFT